MKILVLSDIHANWPALEAVLMVEHSFDTCMFLGDIVDYGPFPHECITLLQPLMSTGVMGNHDFAISYDVDCGCRGDFKQYSEETRAWHKTLLQDDDRNFLLGLPKMARITADGLSIMMAHATPDGDLYKYVSSSDIDHYVAGIDAGFVLLGHTHEQYVKKVGKVTVINPGSVGLARDGSGACSAVIEDGKPLLHRIPYDVGRTIRALEASPISQTSKAGLATLLRGRP
jgi:putative phosphoesterase